MSVVHVLSSPAFGSDPDWVEGPKTLGKLLLFRAINFDRPAREMVWSSAEWRLSLALSFWVSSFSRVFPPSMFAQLMLACYQLCQDLRASSSTTQHIIFPAARPISKTTCVNNKSFTLEFCYTRTYSLLNLYMYLWKGASREEFSSIPDGFRYATTYTNPLRSINPARTASRMPGHIHDPSLMLEQEG